MSNEKEIQLLGPDGSPITHEKLAERATHLKSSYQVKAFDPPSVNFAPTAAETVLPTDLKAQHKLWRSIYNFDPVAGVAVELYGALPFGNFELTGIEDKKVLQIYQESLENLNLESFFPIIAIEFLTLGKVCLHFTFDKKKGVWVDMIDHDPDNLNVIPVPFANASPLVELRPSVELKQFAKNLQHDPRLANLRKRVSSRMIQSLLSNRPIQLADSNTVYLPRKSNMQDYLGTSIYTRILSIVLYERCLQNGNIEAIHRRIGPIRIVSPANFENHPPEVGEMTDYVNALIQANRDDVESYIATKRPLQIDSLNAGEYIKIADEWPLLQDSKLKAMGMSEAFLTGDSSVTSLDTVLSMFLERVRTLRAFFERKIIQEKLFQTLARVHGFKKRTQAELAHGIRSSKSDHIHHGELLTPEIIWDKKLEPYMDRGYMDLLGVLEAKGVPVPLKTWANTINFKLDEQLDKLGEDIKIRQRIFDYQKHLAEINPQQNLSPELGTEGGEQQVSSNFSGNGHSSPSLKKHPFSNNGKFLDVPFQVVARVLGELNSKKALSKPQAWTEICNKNKVDQDKVKYAARYLGLSVPPLSRNSIVSLVTSAVDKAKSDNEFMWLYNSIANNVERNPTAKSKALDELLRTTRHTNGKMSKSLLTGVTKDN